MSPLRIALVAVLGLALAAPAASAEQRRARTPLDHANLSLPTSPFRTTTLRPGDLALPRSFAESGGVYRTSDGIEVHVTVSDAYVPDPESDQAFVNFLGSLLHGPELAALQAVILAPEEVAQVCGAEAVGCYSPAAQTLIVPGESVEDGVPVEHVVAHEYGHHVARNRLNPPWDAGDWGTKRWATQMQICSREARGEVFPGNEGDHYQLNPGEGWAEVYRFQNAALIGGWPTFGWHVVSSLFVPDATLTGLIQQDVVQPWSKPTTSRFSGRLAAGKTRRFTVATPLDGVVKAAATGASRATVRLSRASGQSVTPYGRSASMLACDDRQVVATVRAKKKGAFALTVSRP